MWSNALLGKKDIDSVDDLVQWRSMTKLVEWGSEDSRSIYGSLSGHFQPRIKKHDPLVVFMEPIFR